MADRKTIVVIGAGKGLGNAIGRRFGTEGYRVLLASRNAESLESYVAEFSSEGIEAKGYPVDVTDIEGLDATIKRMKDDFGTPNVVVYNVGITSPDSTPLTAEDVNHHFATDVTGAYQVIEDFADESFASKGGSIILTGGVAAVSPFPGFLCLALDKAALHNLAVYENAELKDRGIFVGTVMVCGVIGSNERFAPGNIAQAFWDLNQKRDEVEVRFQ